MLRLLVALTFILSSVSVLADYSPKKVNNLISKTNRAIAKQSKIDRKLKLLAQLKNDINNLSSPSKGKKYKNLAKLQEAYSALDLDLLAKGQCEIIRADLQFRFNPTGFQKGKIAPQVVQALRTLKTFCPKLKIYQ